MALFVALRKKHQNPFFCRKLPVSLPRNFKKLPSEFYPSNKKGVAGFNALVLLHFFSFEIVGGWGMLVFSTVFIQQALNIHGILWCRMCIFVFAMVDQNPGCFCKKYGPTLCSPWSRDLPRTMKGAIMHLQDRYVAQFFFLHSISRGNYVNLYKSFWEITDFLLCISPLLSRLWCFFWHGATFGISCNQFHKKKD